MLEGGAKGRLRLGGPSEAIFVSNTGQVVWGDGDCWESVPGAADALTTRVRRLISTDDMDAR